MSRPDLTRITQEACDLATVWGLPDTAQADILDCIEYISVLERALDNNLRRQHGRDIDEPRKASIERAERELAQEARQRP